MSGTANGDGLDASAASVAKSNPLSGRSAWKRAAAVVAATAAATLLGQLIGGDPLSVGLVYLVAVLFVSAWGGLAAGLAASLAATLAFNLAFVHPIGTLYVDDPRQVATLAGFLVAALVSSRLVARERERAVAAERALRVAEEARRRDAEASEAMKTALLRAVSHDLRTPLTTLAILHESLRRSLANDPEALETVERIVDETERLDRRISNLLTLARLEAGSAALRREPTPPSDLFRAAVEHLPKIARTRPIRRSVDAGCPELDVDPTLAAEILVNLIENAHRAAPPGSEIELVARGDAGDPASVALEVLDRGPGPTPSPGGAPGGGAGADGARRGLGLEIARSFAAAHGGTLTLEPRAEGGARARLLLPAARTGTP